MTKKLLKRILIIGIAVVLVMLNNARIETNRIIYDEVTTQQFSYEEKMLGFKDIDVKYQYKGKTYHGLVENVPPYVWEKNTYPGIPDGLDALAGAALKLKVYVNPNDLSQVYMVQNYVEFDKAFQAWVIVTIIAGISVLFEKNKKLDKHNKSINK